MDLKIKKILKNKVLDSNKNTMTIKDIEEKGMIAYKYMAGSHSQNLNGPDSSKKYCSVA